MKTVLIEACSGSGNRTRVLAVREPRPRPLDETAVKIVGKSNYLFNFTQTFFVLIT